MFIRETKKSLAVLLMALLLACGLVCPSVAASGDITDVLRDGLRSDLASIELYTPTEGFSLCGEILYSDETGAMTLAVNGEDSAPLSSVTVSGESVYTPPEDSSEEDSWDGTTPYVRSGYVLVTIRAEGRDDYMACISENATLTPEARAAAREAEAAALAAETTGEMEKESAETAESTETPAPLTAAAPEAATETVQRTSLAERIASLSNGGVALLIAGAAFLVAALVEMVLLLVYRSRAENVAKNYIRAKAALDKSKRELAAARTKNLRLERELLQERSKMDAVRAELERMQGKRKPDAPEEAENAPAQRKKKERYDLDYLDWTI